MDGKYLLYIQVIIIALLFYFANIGAIIKNLFLAIPFTAATIIAFYCAYSLGINSYSPFPKPSKTNKLVTGGLYNYARHPIYTSIMIAALVLFLSNPSFQSFLILSVLIYVHDAKASLEEELLAKIHPQYENYKKTTKKFIPKIY